MKKKLLFLTLMAVFGFATSWAQNVAKIGETEYATLQAAIDAVPANGTATIELLANVDNGTGIEIPDSRKNETLDITIDFKNFTYTMTSGPVGSKNTKSQVMHFAGPNNKLTLKNGTIKAADPASIGVKQMMQNYCNLTLDGMTIDCSNIDGGTYGDYSAYPQYAFWSYKSIPVFNFNTGATSTIKNSTIIFRDGDDWGVLADGGNVTLDEGTVINGNVSVTNANSTLTINNGVTINGAVKDIAGTLNATTVAKIGDSKFTTLEAAFAAAQDGETITLLAGCTGNGIRVEAGTFTTGLTVDFAGFTYTVDGATVGSPNTKTNAFQLLKNNNITFKNGAITSAKALILVQNYSNLTLEGMTLTMTNDNYSSAYTLSNNNGEVVINNTTIKANTGGGFAFDVCRYSTYSSVHVTVKGNSVIEGDIQVYASKSDAKDGFSLMLEEGTLNGNIVLDQTAKTAMENNPDKATVSKKDTFNQTAPDGYEWVSNNDGTSTLKKKTPELVLDEATDNSAVLETNNGQTVNVTLTRTLHHGAYNTIALPFAVDKTMLDAVITGNSVHALTGSTYDENEKQLTMNFSDQLTAIEAGKAYLIWVGGSEDIVNPTFEGVTIKNTVATTTSDYVDFVPVINPETKDASMNTMFLGAGSKLYYVSEQSTINGFRGYFNLKGIDASTASSIIKMGGTPTGITTISNDQLTIDNNAAWYTIDGRQLNAQPTQKGIYIHNGKKVVVK